MKFKFFLSALAVLFTTAAFATVRTVSNNPNSPGQYTSMTAAITAATAGDTLLVHGSSVDYGSFTVNKKLTIIGPGHNPQKQAPLAAFTNGTITFSTGSTNSTLIGMKVNTILVGTSGLTGINILLCMITNEIYNPTSSSNNWTVEGCVFTSTSYNCRGNGNSNSNWQFRNNIFNGYLYYTIAPSGSYNYVTNCIFLGSGNVHQSSAYIMFTNNVFYRANAVGTSNSNAIYNRNIVAPASNTTNLNSGATSTNNISGVAGTDVFVTDLGSGALFSYATDYHLVNSSPGKNYGSDGTDLGVYGGPAGAYDQYGTPLNPYVSEFEIPTPAVTNGGTLNINFKSKVRQ